MSAFPHGGNVNDLRNWLDMKGFEGKFSAWEAEALIGLREEHILNEFELPHCQLFFNQSNLNDQMQSFVQQTQRTWNLIKLICLSIVKSFAVYYLSSLLL